MGLTGGGVTQWGEWRAPRPWLQPVPAAKQRQAGPSLAGATEEPYRGPLVQGLTSIIIIAYNRLDVTGPCVESVLAHTSRPYELILVDNGSHDHTGRYFQEVAVTHPQVRVIMKRHNFGVWARTFGMDVARGQYICWLDNDTEVGPGWLEALHAALADPRVGGAGVEGVALTPDWQHRFHTAGWPPEKAAGRRVDIVVGYCFLFRNLFRFLGALDPQFHPFWNEEADYSLRIKLLGYRLVVAPAPVIHHAHGTGLNLLPDRDAQIARMNQALIDKWEPFKERVLEAYWEG